jgi:HSP20 family protein
MNEMMSFRKQIDDMFNSFFTKPFSSGKTPFLFKGQKWAWKPEVDMYETKKEVIVKASLPGCDKKDVKVDVHDNILTIKGKKEEDEEGKEKDFYQREQNFGSFQRSISLPKYANIDKTKATCRNGVLEVKFPKMKSIGGKGKKINIS